MNMFYRNVAIAAVVSFLPGVLAQGSMMGGIVGCLLMIGAIIFMYKLYADSEQTKTKLTLGQGAKFGALVGVVLGILSFLYLVADLDNVRQMAIESMEPMRELMGEEAYDTAVYEIENQSDGQLIMGQMINVVFSVIISSVIGLIAGAIFKHDSDPDADLMNEIQN